MNAERLPTTYCCTDPPGSERPPSQRSSPKSLAWRSASPQGRPLSMAGRWRRSSPTSRHARCSSLMRSTALGERSKRCSIPQWKIAPLTSLLATADRHSRCDSTLPHSPLSALRLASACSLHRSVIASVLSSASTSTTTLISQQSFDAPPASSESRSPLMPLR